MANGINFLDQHRKELRAKQKIQQQWYFWTMILMVIAIVISLATVGISFGIQWQTNQTFEDIEAFEAEIARRENTEESALVLSKKLEILGDLIADRKDKLAAIDYFSTLFGDEILITGLNYDDSGTLLNLSVQAPSIFLLEDVYEKLTEAENSGRFSSLARSSINRDSTASYTMAVTVGLASQEEIEELEEDLEV